MEIIKDKEFAKQATSLLATLGYRFISNPGTGGDNDYMIIDTAHKEYTWFEYGIGPDHHDLFMYQDKRLKDLIKMF